MTVFEILLVIIGLILFGGSFLVSEKITVTKEQLKIAIDENEVKKLLQSQIQDMDEDISHIVIENMENTTGEVKRSMEKLSNEKIMAIDEYSNTVMEAIHKNHNEVMFLYGMLNDKNKEIKETAELITKANKGINKKLFEAQGMIEKMDSQIAFMNQYMDNQTASMEKIEKSTTTIELLEEQLKHIEQMALQFSKDIKEEQESAGYHLEITDNGKEMNHKDSEEIQEKVAVLDEYNIESYEADIEELLENFTNDNGEEMEDRTKDSSNYNHKILDMSKEGQSALEIAKTLGLGVGEVQLVIDLFEGGRR